MQAMFFLILSGLMMGVMGAIIIGSGASTLQYKQNQIATVEDYFKTVELIMNNTIVPEYQEVPRTSTPTQVTGYLQRDEIKELSNWNGSPNTATDPWGTPFTGFVARELKLVRARTGVPSFNVTLPITGFVLVSAGPDKRLDPALQARLSTLGASSQIRDIMNIEKKVTSGATGSADDIVYTFSIETAARQRWQKVEEALSRIANASLRNFSQRVTAFNQKLADEYTTNLRTFYDSSGDLIVNSANITAWQARGVIFPQFAQDSSGADKKAFIRGLGTDGDINFIETASKLTLNVTHQNTHGTRVRLQVVNNGSPWGTLSGQLNFYYELDGGF